MASVVTSFYSRGGTQYRLTLTGTSIPSGKTITLAGESPIKISYPQAQCKFAGLRTVSASIHIIADENMDWLYAAGPTSTSVLIESVDNNVATVIFKGYLVPFVYDMPFQLADDDLEITAVDSISANKNVMYNGNNGDIRRRRVSAYLMECCLAAGIKKFIVQDNFGFGPEDTTVTENIEDLYIVETAFLPSDWVNGKANVSIADVISYIAQFFGLTAVCMYDKLYLYDPIAISEMSLCKCTTYSFTSVNSYSYTTAIAQTSANPLFHHKTVVSDDFEGADARHSIGQAYDVVQVTPVNTEKGWLLPDILKDDTTGTAKATIPFSHGNHRFRVDRQYKVLTKAAVNTHWYRKHSVWNGSAWVDQYDEITVENLAESLTYLTSNQSFGAAPIEFAYWNRDTPPYVYWEDKLEYTGITKKKMLWVRIQAIAATWGISDFTQFALKRKPYNDGRKFRIFMRAMRENNNMGEPPVVAPASGTDDRITGPLVLNALYMKLGSKYYQKDTSSSYKIQQKWTTTQAVAPMTCGTDQTKGEMSNIFTYMAFEEMDTGWLDQVSDKGNFDIYYAASTQPGVNAFNEWITEFSIEIAEKDYEEKDTRLLINNSEEGERMDVSCGLVSAYGHNMACQVDATQFEGSYLGESVASYSGMDHCGILLTQLQRRYGQPQHSFQLTLGADIMPWTRLTFLNGVYTVDSMEWDLEADSKKVVIN